MVAVSVASANLITVGSPALSVKKTKVAVSVASANLIAVVSPAVSVNKLKVAVSVGSEYINAVVDPAESVSGMKVSENAIKVTVEVMVAVVCPDLSVMYDEMALLMKL